ncbi:MAG: choice-of-anchor Q domain-containing protein [Pyrinomonadaceae bacterium]
MVTVVNVTNSSITNNHADGSGGDGGGIYNDSGRSTITNSTISGNTTQGSGGGFFANKGLHNIIGTTLSGNSARSSATTSSRRGGGGLAVVGQGTVNIANATVSGNSSDCLCGGGGISTVDGTVTTLRNVTVANNSASAGPGGGITTEVPIAYLTTTNIGNTIIADNTATTDPDVNGRIVSQGFNLVRNRGASTGYVASDLPNGSNPSLQALGNYGGPTQTHQLLVGSAAIDRGSNALAVDPSNNTALATDQRGAGFARIRDGNLDGAAIVDIGAFEVQTGTLPPADLTVVKSHTGNFTQRDTGKTYSITVTNSGRTATSGTVTVKDTLPTGLSATAISGAGWTCTLATLTCTRSDSLAASASYPAITLTVNVAANAPSSVTNTATVSGGGETNTTNNTAADPTTINAAATYSISGQVTNGGTALQGVTVSLGSALTATTVTNALGQYSFSNLASGVNYTVTSALNGYTFAPVSTAVNNLTMNQTSVNFATSTTTYEGDVATRPTGDGAVDIFDLVAVGRIIALLDPAPANGSELQRADVAPRLNGFASLARGDGAVDVLDMVQIGRYSAVLDARTQAGGPIAPAPAANQLIGNYTDQKDGGGEAASASAESAEGQAAVMAPTALSAGSVTVSSTTAVVPIQLTTTGDTQALQFSITYDQTKLAVPADLAVAFTNRYPNTTFIFNTATAGRIGVVAYQPIDGTSVFPAGAVTLFNIKFTLVGTPSGTATIDFSDTPVPRRASTPAAAAVAVTSAPGTVTFLAPTAASVSISGRVTTASGRGIVNVRLTLTDSNGQIRTARTTSFGYYRFDAVQAGETYILSAIGKRYTFSQPVQVLNVNEETDAVNFIADSEKRRIVF